MNSENDLMNKLLISRKIMERHNQMDRSGETPRGNVQQTQYSSPMVENYEPVQGTYNIPQEYMTESRPIPNPTTPTRDKIMSSNLPDEIKRIMIENPIEKPTMGSNVGISNELVEKAARLMNSDASGKQLSQTNKRQPQRQNVHENVLDVSNLRDLLKEVVTEVLTENGLLTESSQKTKDVFSFRVGKHIFEGNVTKIKRIR